MSSAKFECQKFSPNIFNKSKCQHCFRSKDQHSAEALECNRVSRKISKCGYLFVAPDWDFSIPMNRTKRWQRRWFVLYEDGELTYSVDEHPDTIPQAIIEMTKVVEVSDGEDVTGNKFAIAITAPDKIYFIKGTCKEESKWWFDVLVMYPRSLKGRQKRNATFPCIKATTSVPSVKTRVADGQGSWGETVVPRYRFLSCHTETNSLGYDQIDVGLKNAQNSSIKPLLELEERTTICEKSKIEDSIPRDIEIILADNSRRSRVDSHYSKRCQKRESRLHQSQRSRSLGAPLSNSSSTEDLSEVPPAAVPASEALSHLRVSSPLYARLSDVPKMKRYDSLETLQQDHHGPLSPRAWYQGEEGEENNRNRSNVEAPSHDQLQRPAKSNRLPYSQLREAKKERQGSATGSKTPYSPHDSQAYPSSASSEYERKKEVDKEGDNAWREHTIRGDPDGCGLDHIVRCPSSIPEIRVDPMDLYSENILNFKKGWLMRQEVNKEWCKRWCILYGSSLKVYQDLKAEDSGNLDSIISMNLVQHVEEVDVGRNYGFKIKMSDNKCHIFSAVTAGIRSNWVYALKNAANVRELEDVVSMGEHIEREIPHMNNLDSKTRSASEGSTSKQRSLISRPPSVFSSDEELRLIPGALAETPCARIPEGDSAPLGPPAANSRTLPPSPPLNRTAISKVKERARLKTNVKVLHKSSKSPPAPLGDAENEVVDKTYWSRAERQDGADRVSVNSTKLETNEDTKEFGSPSIRNARSKDKSRRYTLPGKNGTEAKLVEAATPTKISSRISARPSKDKEMKWHGDHHCSSLFERNRLIEALQTRLQRSENKIHDLENEMEVLCKSHGPSSDGEASQREEARPAVTPDRKAGGKSPESCQDEIAKLKEALDNANGELIDVVNRLQKATDENESLRKTFGTELGSIKKLPRVGSLSDLTNIGEEVDVDSTSREALAEKYKELRGRFEKAVNEIRVLKKELKEAYGKCDELEVLCMNQKHNLAALETDYKSQLGLMSVRIEDLTTKFSNSEKQLRHQMKQRPASKEGKEQRRTRSLKGRESLTVSKEVENKVEELEKKLRKVEVLLKTPDEEAPEGDAETKKVGEGAAEADKQVHVFVRLNALEAKVHGVSHRAQSLSSSRTSLATEVNADDIETDEASLFNKSEGCPSDYETSDKDAPVALISELNGQIQSLRSRTFELELALRGCRQKVEQCKDVVDALGGAGGEQLRLVGEHLRDAVRWLDGSTSTAFGPALRDFFPDILHRLNELALGKVHDFSGDHNLLAAQRAHRSSILSTLSRALCVTPAKPDCPHRCLLEAARRLGSAMQMLVGRLDTMALPQVALLDETLSSEGDNTELLEAALHALVKNEAVIQGLAAPWKEDKMLMLVGACLDEAQGGPREFEVLPTAVLLREVFARTQADALRAMAEAEVVDVVARLLHGSESEALAWVQKTEEQRTRTVAEHLALEVDNVFHVLKSGVAAARNTEKGTHKRLGGAVVREYAEVVTQAALLGGSLAFLRSLTASTGTDCPGAEYCTFCEAPLVLASPRCPPPRVVGEVIKAGHCAAGLAAASHSAEKEAQSPWAPKEAQDVEQKVWRRERLGFGSPQDSCQQCKELQRKVQQMAEKYASDLLFETERHQAKLEAVYQEQALKLSALETNHLDQEEKYQKEILVLNEKLNSLEEDYESQILSLKEMFEQEISKRTNIKFNKANVQRKYRAEIEQLKTLCEKGLLAMEHSNKRIIAELEEKHRRELEQLQVEKEQALAEETQATLAALDAMRKAHEAELQREVSRFKEEFLQKMDHSSADLDALHREHEEEMETIKHEILALSSKYSVKCLECAALEEHLEVMTQKLAEANSIIFDLTARNKQLRTHLKQNIRGLSTMVKSISQLDKETMKDLQLSLQLKESQLAEKEEEIADLNGKLTATKNHENELENHCRSLDASLKADNKACEDDMGTLRARLEHIILAHQPNLEGPPTVRHMEQERLQTCYRLSEPKSKRSNGNGTTSRGNGAELMRSPSCPGLSLPDSKVGKLNHKSGGAATPVAGVVASRKKIFEYQDGKRS